MNHWQEASSTMLLRISCVFLSTALLAGSPDEANVDTFEGKNAREWYEILENSEGRSRSRAAEALSVIGFESVQVLVGGLQKDDGELRAWSIRTLSWIGPEAAEAAPLLRKLADGSSDDSTINNVVQALGELGAEGTSALMELVKSENEPVRRAAGLQLAQISPALVSGELSDDIVSMYLSAFDEIQGMSEAERGEGHPAYVLMSLSRLGELAAKATPRLVEILEDDDPETVAGACKVLGSIGPPAKSSESALRKQAKSDDAHVRVAAVTALLRVAPSDSDVLRAVVDLLGDEDLNTQAEALAALSDIGPAAEPAVPNLARYLSQQEDDLQKLQVVGVLESIGDAARPRLRQILETTEDSLLRLAARQALGSLGSDDVPSLLRALDHDEYGVREWAAAAFADVGSLALTALAEALEDETINRTWVISALRAVGLGAVPLLLGVLDDPNPAIRFHGLSALGAIGPNSPAVSDALRKAKADSDRNCRRAARDALNEVLRSHPELRRRA